MARRSPEAERSGDEAATEAGSSAAGGHGRGAARSTWKASREIHLGGEPPGGRGGRRELSPMRDLVAAMVAGEGGEGGGAPVMEGGRRSAGRRARDGRGVPAPGVFDLVKRQGRHPWTRCEEAAAA